jgi:hypothetical protein
MTTSIQMLFTSAVRTLTPIIAGWVITVLAKLGLEEMFSIDQWEGWVTAALMTLLTGVYYVIVRALETFKSSKWGWLLGKATAPTYPPPLVMPPRPEGEDRGGIDVTTVLVVILIVVLIIFLLQRI